MTFGSFAVAAIVLSATMAGQEVARYVSPRVVQSVNPEYTPEARMSREANGYLVVTRN
jgi:hypothetical protein